MASNMVKDLNAVAASRGLGKLTDLDVYNSVVNGMKLKGTLPEYLNGKDFKPYGDELERDPDEFSDYLQSLTRQFGLIFIKYQLAQNPLNYYRRGVMAAGSDIESIVMDIIPQMPYSPFYKDEHGFAQSPFEQNLQNPVVGVYRQVLDTSTPTTIIDTVDTMYFQNLTQFHNFIYARITALINGAIRDDYETSKLTVTQPIADDIMPIYNINNQISANEPDPEKALTKKVVKGIRLLVKKLPYFSNKFNKQGVTQATSLNDVDIIISADASNSIDIDFYGQMFNPENGAINVHKTEIDQFPDIWEYSKDHVVTAADAPYIKIKSQESTFGTYAIGDTIKQGTLARAGAPDAVKVFDGSKIAAIVLDHDAFQIWDNLPTRLTSVVNVRGRYQNVYLNKKTTYAYIKGLNAIAVTVSDNPDGQLEDNDQGSNSSNGSNGSTGSNDSNGTNSSGSATKSSK